MRQEVVCKRQGRPAVSREISESRQTPVTPEGSSQMPTAGLACSAGHFQGGLSPVRLAVVARRQRHLSPELSSEMACVAESPAVRNRGDRKVRVHEIVSGSG